MSKYVSFSLWGDLPKYTLGAIRNAELQKKFYPGWVCIFWADETVPIDTLRRLLDLGAIVQAGSEDIPKMFWRFLINDFPDCERYIVRDADSRFSARESAAISDWINGGAMAHSCRDHWAHAREINGGLFGAVRGAIPSMRQLIDDYGPDDTYSDDQTFLCRKVWPMVKHSCLQHDSVSRHLFPGSVPFPTKRNGSKRFVGEVMDIGPNGEDIPRDFDCAAIDEWKD